MASHGSAKRRKTDLLLWLYDHRCFWCNIKVQVYARPTAYYAPSLDELKPRMHGGIQALENQVVAHRICNMRRGATIAASEAFERHHALLKEHGLFCEELHPDRKPRTFL